MSLDLVYLSILAPGLLIALLATFVTRRTYARYRRRRLASGLTGSQVAHEILMENGITDVNIVQTGRMMPDHYAPRSRTYRLTPHVHCHGSWTTAAIAAHEAGHALQHAERSRLLVLRSTALPLARLSAVATWIVPICGLLFQDPSLLHAGMVLFSLTIFLRLITLAVELDASTRARHQLRRLGLVLAPEARGIDQLLLAAALSSLAGPFSVLLRLTDHLLRTLHRARARRRALTRSASR
jgi:Zn-dependent membrane protease YugP